MKAREPKEKTASAMEQANLSANEAMNGWGACSEICPPPGDRIAYPSIAEHCIILHVANLDDLERRLDGGKWQSSPTYPGTLTFIPARCASEWLWEAEVELLEIYLPPSVLENTAIATFERAPQTIELVERFAIRDPLLEQLALAFKAEMKRGLPLNRLYLESLQTVLTVHLLRNHCTVAIAEYSVSGGLSKSKLKQIIHYIQDNLERDIGLEELARVVQVSPHHFGKLFKESMGVSPHQYVLKCRIDRAKKLLGDEKRSLSEISHALGFCDQSHFTNVFRRYTTLTPRQYRNKL